MSKLIIVAVIPCRNEAKMIGDLVSAVKQYVSHVVVVNNASKDNTAILASEAGASVVFCGRQGAGATTTAGLDVCSRADVVVTLDGDGQHDPADIPALLEPILRGEADVVIGSRFLHPNPKIKKYRRFGIGVITWALNLGASTKFTDGQCCFRAFTRGALRKTTITEKGFGFSVEVIVKARTAGLRIVEVPVRCIYHERLADNSCMHPALHGFSVLLKTIWWRLRMLRPALS